MTDGESFSFIVDLGLVEETILLGVFLRAMEVIPNGLFLSMGKALTKNLSDRLDGKGIESVMVGFDMISISDLDLAQRAIKEMTYNRGAISRGNLRFMSALRDALAIEIAARQGMLAAEGKTNH